MSVVPLSAGMRNNLLSLQNTASLTKQVQSRLSTGLRVATAIDDPVSYFQSKSLMDRASDLNVRKDQINQGISTVTAASNGLQGVTDVIRQLQGLMASARSASSSTAIEDLVTQFNMLRQQIDSLAADASYQGINLINGTGHQLEVSFSGSSTSYLTVKSLDARARGVGIDAVRDIRQQFATTVPPVGILSGRVGFDYGGSINSVVLKEGQSLSFTLAMTANVFLGSTSGIIQFSYGSLTVSIAGGGGGPTPSPFAGIVSAAIGDVGVATSPLGIAGAPNSAALPVWTLPSQVYYTGYNGSTANTDAIRQAARDAGFTDAQASQIVTAALTAADNAWGGGSISTQVYDAINAAMTTNTVNEALSVVRSATINTAIAGGYSAEEAAIIADAAYAAASHNVGSLSGTVTDQIRTLTIKAAAGSLTGAAAIGARRKAEEISGTGGGGGGGGGTGLTGMLTDGMVLSFDVTAMAANKDPTDNQIKVEGLTDPNGAVTLTPFDGQITLGMGMLRTSEIVRKQLDSALIQVRSATQSLGLNIALLQIRLEFSTAYISDLVAGAGKLTLADINAESAQMLALQTRQQLGIQALSLSTGRGILQLFQ